MKTLMKKINTYEDMEAAMKLCPKHFPLDRHQVEKGIAIRQGPGKTRILIAIRFLMYESRV